MGTCRCKQDNLQAGGPSRVFFLNRSALPTYLRFSLESRFVENKCLKPPDLTPPPEFVPVQAIEIFSPETNTRSVYIPDELNVWKNKNTRVYVYV